MQTDEFLKYLAVMAGVTYLVRTLPLLLFRKKIENRFIRSFLAYIPYAVLGCMTFPAIFYSTGDMISAAAGTAAGAALAVKDKGLVIVAAAACAAALAVKLIAAAV